MNYWLLPKQEKTRKVVLNLVGIVIEVSTIGASIISQPFLRLSRQINEFYKHMIIVFNTRYDPFETDF